MMFKQISAAAVGTLLSRIFGCGRDFLLAYCFGADALSDAYVIAFRIPNMFRRYMAEGAFAQAFVPIFSRFHRQEPMLAKSRFGQVWLMWLFLTMGIAVWLRHDAATVLHWMAPGLTQDSERGQYALKLLGYFVWFIPMVCLLAVNNSWANIHNRFGIPACWPALFNLIWIVIVFIHTQGVGSARQTMVAAVLIGGITPLVCSSLWLWRIGLSPGFSCHWGWWVDFLKTWGMAILSLIVSQGILWLETYYLSFLASGQISWVYYATRLIEFPLGMIGVAVANVMVPKLSVLVAEDLSQTQKVVQWGLLFAFFCSWPATIGLMIAAHPIAHAILQHGRLHAYDAEQIAVAICWGAPALLAAMWQKVLCSLCYARSRYHYGMIANGCHMIVYALVVHSYLHSLGYLSLLLASLCGQSTQVLVLAYLAWRNKWLVWSQFSWSHWRRVGLAGLIMGIILWCLTQKMHAWVAGYQLMVLMVTGIVVFLLMTRPWRAILTT